MKSHKIVNFPLVSFDPSQYLAPRKHSLCKCDNEGNQPDISRHGDSVDNQVIGDNEYQRNCDKNDPGMCDDFSPKKGSQYCLKLKRFPISHSCCTDINILVLIYYVLIFMNVFNLCYKETFSVFNLYLINVIQITNRQI